MDYEDFAALSLACVAMISAFMRSMAAVRQTDGYLSMMLTLLKSIDVQTIRHLEVFLAAASPPHNTPNLLAMVAMMHLREATLSCAALEAASQWIRSKVEERDVRFDRVRFDSSVAEMVESAIQVIDVPFDMQQPQQTN